MSLIHSNKIDYSKVRVRTRALKDLKQNKVKEIHALDTETLNGYARLVADDTGKYEFLHSVEDSLSYLTSRRFRKSANFFYNIQFDFDALMKYLDVDLLTELVLTTKLEYGQYKIKYIPKKMFTVTVNGNSHSFYDLAQFYEMSLEEAAKKYTKRFKNEDNLDRARIGSERAYWDKYEPLIIKYCIQDCAITRDLGQLLQEELLETTGHTPKRYISKAGISKDYFRRRCKIPDVRKVPNYALYYAFQSYHGGRFEVTERGDIGECTALDLNSAYPYEITRLIDITKGVWRRTTYLNPEAHYGFYLATVDINYTHMPPLAMNAYGTVIYPCGSWTAYFTKEELEALKGYGSYKIIGGAEFWPTELIYPFKDAIEILYEKKRNTPKSAYQYALYKKIMNSLYGCFYEKIKQTDGTFKAGLLFNPVYASLICANTRLELWRKGCEYGKGCVSMATDGLLIKGALDVEDTKELGAWGFDGIGDTTILRSGIYAIGDTMKQRCVIKAKTYRTPHGSFDNLFDYIRQFPDFKRYPVLNHRPYHMRECMIHNKMRTKEDINVFTDSELAFDLNTDVKRIFDVQDITGYELMNMRIKSKPWLWGLED